MGYAIRILLSGAGFSPSLTARLHLPSTTIGVACLVLQGCGHFASDSAAARDQAPAQGASAGPLVCDEAVWNVGEVMAQSRHHRVFKLVNRGADEVVIRHVQGDCGCLVTTAERKRVPPGASFDIDVDFTAPPTTGPLRHGISVATESPNSQSMTLLVRGAVTPNPSLYSPTPEIDFGQVRGEESAVRTLVMARHDGSDVRFQGVQTDNDAVRVEGEPESAATLRNALAIRVALVPENLPLGRSAFWMKVRTDQAASFAEMPVRVLVHKLSDGPFLEAVSVTGLRPGSPQRVSIVRPGATGVPRVVEARFVEDESIVVTPVRADDGAFSGEAEISLAHAETSTQGARLIEGVLELVVEGSEAPVNVPARIFALATAATVSTTEAAK